MMCWFNKWGFNVFGKWFKGVDLRFLFIIVFIFVVGVKRIKWVVDFFDEFFEVMVWNGVKDKFGKLKDFLWVIGYIFESEFGWMIDIVNGIFVFLLDVFVWWVFIEFVFKWFNIFCEKNNGYNKVECDVREMLVIVKLFLCELREYVFDFIWFVFDWYYIMVFRIICEFVLNYFFLGSLLILGWRSLFEWEEGSVCYVDVLSFDVYVKLVDWIKCYIVFDKLIFVFEFGFVCFYCGMDFFLSVSVESEDYCGRFFVEIVGEFVGYL